MGFLSWSERLLETRDDPLPNKADVVIGIDFGLAADGISASPQSEAIARKCLKLFQSGITENVIFSGGVSKMGITSAEAMGEIIKEKIPPEKLFLETESRRTSGNARCSLDIMQEHNWKTAVVVAQQWHARRVRATLRKMWANAGVDFYVIKAHSPYGGGFDSTAKNFLFFFVWDTLSFIYFKFKGYC